MKRAQPRVLSRRRIQKLLSAARSDSSAGARIEALSRKFLGLPYITNLIGSAEQPEVFVASVDGFDCVTYIETVLALSRASNVEEFGEVLRNLRYDRGRVDWKKRNHYMTQWIRNNTRSGALRRIPAKVPRRAKTRLLNVVPGLPASSASFECVPKQAISQLMPQLQTGDLIFFASTRKHLDVFHCGLLVRDGERLRMRHASRSRKGVVEQDLGEFLKDNRMAGVIVVRPAGDRNP
jgi:hypothetical protein